MSATFKNARKKQLQSEFRRCLNEHKGKLQKDVKHIESPLAKYNDTGQLMCILCQSVVRSEAIWAIHINSKQHRHNIELAKKLKQNTNNFTEPVKRPLTPPSSESSSKKLKSILVNGRNNSSSISLAPETVLKTETQIEVQPSTSTKSQLDPSTTELPEGFFDDPRLDAKARHQDYKDPVEEEWERFQKEIREADTFSAGLIADDHEEATNERQIEEIDDQMNKLTTVLDLVQKKGSITKTNSVHIDVNMSVDSDDEDPNDIDEFLDWRSKRSFR